MSDLALLFHRQWSLPLLVELLRGEERRPAALARKLSASRQTVNDTLASLLQLGLVEAAEGAMALTRKGERVAERAEALLAALRKSAGEEALRKWALPVLHALGKRPQRFGELKESLHGATPRALSMSLKDLLAAGLVDRRVLPGWPPGTEYFLLPRAKSLPALLEQLARA